jgi:hypothetical protein
MSHPILDIWLEGTTCNRNTVTKSVLFENDEYIILKHHSHAEYCGRGSGTQTCGVYACLYNKTDIAEYFKDHKYSFNTIQCKIHWKMWEGRLNKKDILQYCADVGIIFE